MDHAPDDTASTNGDLAEAVEQFDPYTPIHMVYSNNLLMRKIVSHISHLPDRVSVELSSRRLQWLSKTSKFRFSSRADHLKVVFRLHNYRAVMELADICLAVPCLTFGIRRENGNATSQPSVFQDTLHGIGSRFSNDLEKISLGGRRQIDMDRGIPDNVLVITRDILEWVNLNTPNLKSLDLDGVVFDAQALDYFLSDVCTFHLRLTEISCNRVCFDDRANGAPRFITKLIHRGVKRFSLNTFGVTSTGTYILDVLESKGLRLDILTLGLDDGCMGNDVDAEMGSNFLSRASRFVDDLRLKYWSQHRDATVSSLFEMSRGISSFKNITELDVNVVAQDVADTICLSYISRNIDHMPSLRSYTFGGYKSSPRADQALRCLNAGLHGTSLLTCLTISNIPTENSLLLNELIDSIPLSLVELTVKDVGFDDNMMIRLLQRLPNLRTLVISHMRRLTSFTTYQTLKTMSRLEKFECDRLCAPLICPLLTDFNKLPNLDECELLLSRKPDAELIQLLRKHFRHVYIELTYIGMRKERKVYYLNVTDRLTNADPPNADLFAINAQQVKPQRGYSPPQLEWE